LARKLLTMLASPSLPFAVCYDLLGSQRRSCCRRRAGTGRLRSFSWQSQRNIGLMVVGYRTSTRVGFGSLFALCQFPIYLSPHLLQAAGAALLRAPVRQ